MQLLLHGERRGIAPATVGLLPQEPDRRPGEVLAAFLALLWPRLRDRHNQITAVLAAARDTLIATPKLRLLLDEKGLALAAASIREPPALRSLTSKCAVSPS